MLKRSFFQFFDFFLRNATIIGNKIIVNKQTTTKSLI